MSKFLELGLSEQICDALSKLGYEQPTEIQEKAIPQVLKSSKDLKAFAQTGTGKTAAFSLPIIHQIDLREKHTQALILSPTRELAVQIQKNIEQFSANIKELTSMAVYGGASIEDQIRKLRRGAQIVVATPGRAVDLVRRKQLNLAEIKWLVLDEADEMLNMGFKSELDKLLENASSERQTLLFSATFPREVERISRSYMVDPFEIGASKKDKGSDQIEHQYFMVSERNRYEALKRIADANPSIYGIVFCRTRKDTQEIADKLINDGYSADSLHGDLSQAQRDSVMDKFRKKHLQMLVATDVAARGLDVNDLTHVINYRLPDQPEAYTHRSGRTGRAGKKGISIAIVNPKERNKLRPIEKTIGKKFASTPVPSGKEICQSQLFTLINKVHDIKINDSEISEFLPAIYEKLASLDREELIKRFVSLEFNTFLSYYENAVDLNNTEQTQNDFGRRSDEQMTRFFTNIGKRDQLNPARLIGLINDQNIGKNIEIGKIEILESFSFFEIEKGYEDEIIHAFKNEEISFEGRNVNVEVTKNQRSGGGKGSKRNFRGSGGSGYSGGSGGFGNSGGSGNSGYSGRNNNYKGKSSSSKFSNNFKKRDRD